MNAPRPEVFDELLEILMPWAGGYAVLLRAYFDASMREGDTLCVAALAFGADNATKAERAWRQLMGARIAHLTDMHARQEDFYGISDEEAEYLIRSQVQVINRYSSMGVAYSCSLKEITPLLPKNTARGSEPLLDGFRTAYAMLCHIAMFTLGRFAEKPSGEPQLAYIFESGDEYQAQSARFIEHAAQFQQDIRMYSCRSHSYVQKGDMRLLETADVLAWEWAKHVNRRAEGKPIRGSLAAILGKKIDGVAYASPAFRCLHMTGPNLERSCSKINQLLQATTKEEIAAIHVSFSGEDSALAKGL